MRWQVAWTKHGRRDLRDVIKFCAEMDPLWAERAEIAIAEGIEFLSTSPFISSIYAVYEFGEVREYLAGDFRLFFKVFEDEHAIQFNGVRHIRQQDPDFAEE